MAGTLIVVNNFMAYPLSNGNATMSFSAYHGDYDGATLPGEPVVQCSGESAPVNGVFNGSLTCTPDTRFKYRFGLDPFISNQPLQLETRAFDSNGLLIGTYWFQKENFTADGCYYGSPSLDYVLNLYG